MADIAIKRLFVTKVMDRHTVNVQSGHYRTVIPGLISGHSVNDYNSVERPESHTAVRESDSISFCESVAKLAVKKHEVM